MSPDEESKAIESLAKLIQTMIEAVALAGSIGIPSGQFYVMMQSTLPQVVTNVDRYNVLVEAMVATGKVTCKHHVLRAVK